MLPNTGFVVLILIVLLNNNYNNYYNYSIILTFAVSSSSQEGQLIKVSEGCFCPGSAVTYECTVNGGSGNAETTIWKGSVFSYLCPDFNNHALLFHGRYGLPGGTRVVCNDGAIVARSVSMSSNGVYTSQLLITLTLEVIEKGYSVECDHDDGENITAVGSLNITSGSLLGKKCYRIINFDQCSLLLFHRARQF